MSDGRTLVVWLGDSLRRLNITQTDLAKRTGLSASYINDIMQGRRIPPRHTVIALAEATSGHAEYLALVCGHVPPRMDGLSMDELDACLSLVTGRPSMKEDDEPDGRDLCYSD